jgi:murein L,D-transpeptidase YafK
MTHNKLTHAVFVFMVILAIVLFLERKHITKLVEKLSRFGRSLGPTVEDHVAKYGPTAHRRVAAVFRAKGLEYPPDKLALVAFKDARQIQVYAFNGGKPPKFVRSYTIFGASGTPGPKLKEGDRQVPEGIYHISLEPNCPYHLGLRLDYPNDFDRAHAKEDGRTNLGADILIHGGNDSIGCLAVGDQASEDLYVTAYDTKDQSIPVIISPVDPRLSDMPSPKPNDPRWLPGLYQTLKKVLALFPLPDQRK